MSKRELTEDEVKLSKSGLKRNTEDLKKIEENLEYNKALIDKQNYLRNFDDKWRIYLRDQKNTEDKKIFGMIEEEITNHKQVIKNLQKQLNEGVTIKTPSGVN